MRSSQTILDSPIEGSNFKNGNSLTKTDEQQLFYCRFTGLLSKLKNILNFIKDKKSYSSNTKLSHELKIDLFQVYFSLFKLKQISIRKNFQTPYLNWLEKLNLNQFNLERESFSKYSRNFSYQKKDQFYIQVKEPNDISLNKININSIFNGLLIRIFNLWFPGSFDQSKLFRLCFSFKTNYYLDIKQYKNSSESKNLQLKYYGLFPRIFQIFSEGFKINERIHKCLRFTISSKIGKIEFAVKSERQIIFDL